MRKEVPLIVTFIAGAGIMAGFFLQAPLVKVSLSANLLNWAVIISAFALALGAGNLTRLHGLNLSRRGKNWALSGLLLLGLWGFFLLGLVKGPTYSSYTYIFNAVLVPGSATVMALNGFYIISACYRTFRMRSWQATLMVLTAVVVALGRVGIGQAMWPALGPISDWINRYPNASAMRGIVIGAALGTVSLGIRVILGIERGHLGAEGG